MKRANPTAISTLFLLLGALAASHAQAQSTNLQLRLESRTNALDLIVEGGAAGAGWPRMARAVTILCGTSVNHQPMKEQTV